MTRKMIITYLQLQVVTTSTTFFLTYIPQSRQSLVHFLIWALESGLVGSVSHERPNTP